MSTALTVIAAVAAYWTGRKRPVQRARAWNAARILGATPRGLDALIWFVLHPVRGTVQVRERRAEQETTESVDLAHELFGTRENAARR